MFEDANDPESRGMHFYKEAKQRFEQEDGRITIPTVQGYATLLTRYDIFPIREEFADLSSMALIGKDRLVWLSLGQLGRMVADISSSNLPMQLYSDPNKRDEGKAIDNTIWGVYNLTACVPQRSNSRASCYEKDLFAETFLGCFRPFS